MFFMALLPTWLIKVLISIATIVVFSIVFLSWRLYCYWNNRGIKSLTPELFYGDAKDFLSGRLSIGQQFALYYNTFKSQKLKYGGIFLGPKPIFVPVDLDVIRTILHRDFKHFSNRGFYSDDVNDPLSAHLFNLQDSKWGDMRKMLNPAFVAGQMSTMFPTMAQVSHVLKTIFDGAVKKDTPIELKRILGLYTTDVIASCAFGLECNSLKDPDVEFRQYQRKIFRLNPHDKLKHIFQFILPHSVLKHMKSKFTKTDVEEYVLRTVSTVATDREQNNLYRRDFIHLFLQLKNRGHVHTDHIIAHDETRNPTAKAIDIYQLAAQCYSFLFSGFETTLNATTFALYEIAANRGIYLKLRKEIASVVQKHNGVVTYDAIEEMNYLNALFSETLRKYPPLPILSRTCSLDYNIPFTTSQLPKNQGVIIPVLGLHMDPDYFPEPEKFNPERFLGANSPRPYSYLPFGEGPRNCIGWRFGTIVSKLAIVTIMMHFKIELSDLTKKPLEIDTNSITTTPYRDVWIKAAGLR